MQLNVFPITDIPKVFIVRLATWSLFSASELKSMYIPLLDPIQLTPNCPVPVWAIWHCSKPNLGIILRCGWHATCNNTLCCLEEEAENTWSASWELYWWDRWYQGCSTHLFGWYFLQLRRTDSTALVHLLKKKFCPEKKILESLTPCLTGEPWGHLGDCSSWMCDLPLWLEESHGERQERRGHLPEEEDHFAAGFLAAHRQHGWQWHLHLPQGSPEKLWQRGLLPARLVFLWASLHVWWVLSFGALAEAPGSWGEPAHFYV